MSGIIGRRVYADTRWQQARQATLIRDGYRCTKCKRPGRLEVHHRYAIAEYPNRNHFDIAELRTLCRPCHFGEHEQIPAELAAWRRLTSGA